MNFTELEQQVITEIVKLDNNRNLNVLGNVLEHNLLYSHGYYIELESESKCSLQIEKNYFDELSTGRGDPGFKNLIMGISHDLIVIVTLLNNLERQDLITITGEINVTFIGRKILDGKYIEYSQFDPETVTLLYKYARKIITPSATLINLVKNHFLTEEELNNQKQLRQGQRNITLLTVTIVVSVVIFLTNLVISLVTTPHVKLDNQKVEVTVDQTELLLRLDSLIQNEKVTQSNIVIDRKDLEALLKMAIEK